MAIFGNNIITGKKNDIFCDSASDVSNLPAFAEQHDLKPGSTCLCIDNSNVYAMKSNGTWKPI